MKKIFKAFSVISAAVCLFAACDPMDASIQEFIEDGPRVYLAKVDSLQVFSGINHAKLCWKSSTDSRIKGAIIYWNNRNGQKEISWNPSEDGEVIVEGLSSGSAIFEVVTVDGKGNTSIPVSISGNVFGPEFESMIDDYATITSGFFNETTNAVDLVLKPSNSIYYTSMELKYELLSGADTVIVVPKDSTIIHIEGISSPEVHYSALFLPEEGCIDIFHGPSHLYEDLYNPYCDVAATSGIVAAVTESSFTTTFTANRAPVSASSEASWLDVEISNEDGTVTVTTKEVNKTGADRTADLIVKAGTFEKTVTITQKRDLRGTAYKTEGVIFWQNPDNWKEYKIISAQRGSCKWSNESVVVGTNVATYQAAGTNASKWHSFLGTTNGTPNDAIIAARVAQVPAGTYPAYEWCKALGEGWRLPSALELRLLFEVYNGLDFDSATASNPNGLTAAEKASRAAFEAVLVDLGGEKLNTQADNAEGDWLWDDMEEKAANALAFRFGNRGHGSRAKTLDGAGASGKNKIYTRAVKVVTIED